MEHQRHAVGSFVLDPALHPLPTTPSKSRVGAIEAARAHPILSNSLRIIIMATAVLHTAVTTTQANGATEFMVP